MGKKWVYDCMPYDLATFFSFRKTPNKRYITERYCAFNKFKARHNAEGISNYSWSFQDVYQLRCRKQNQIFYRWKNVDAVAYFRIIKEFKAAIEKVKAKKRANIRKKENDLKYLKELEKHGMTLKNDKVMIDGIPVSADDYKQLKQKEMLDDKYIIPNKTVTVSERVDVFIASIPKSVLAKPSLTIKNNKVIIRDDVRVSEVEVLDDEYRKLDIKE